MHPHDEVRKLMSTFHTRSSASVNSANSRRGMLLHSRSGRVIEPHQGLGENHQTAWIGAARGLSSQRTTPMEEPMTTQRIYTLPVEQTMWKVNGSSEVIFNWEYDEMRDNLLSLYSKGKHKQWDAATRIDWSQDVDP